MKVKYSTIAMSRNKYLSFRTAEGVRKTLFKANVTVLLLILRNNVTISRLYRIGRQLQPVELAASELADNFSLVIEEIDESECLAEFRFRKRDIVALSDVLQIPAIIECEQR